MWQRFTERARRIVFYAQEHAGRMGTKLVGPEHLLLGMLQENDCIAVRLLEKLDVSLERLKSEVEQQLTRGNRRSGRDMQLTPRAKRVVDLSYDEARILNNNYIGTEHLLLGLVREEESLAARVLSSNKVSLDALRNEIRLLQDPFAVPTQPSAREQEVNRMTMPMPNADSLTNVSYASYIVKANKLGLQGKSLLSIADLNATQIRGILDVAQAMSDAHKSGKWVVKYSYPKSLACIFEKPSLRTRVTFDLGMQQLGGLAVVLGPSEIGLGTRESIPDVAHCLERWVDCIMARVFKHETLVGLRDNCSIPVINGLSDREHPCQVLADLLTIRQKKGKLEGLKLAWLGDGFNMLHSLMLGGALTGMAVAAACPDGYWPLPEIVEQARALAGDPKRIILTNEIDPVVADADVVVTDTWTSMGQEEEAKIRRQAFGAYQVNSILLAKAKPDAIFLHCLPAHRGEEATDDVLDGPQSVIFDEAENRLHAQKAVVAAVVRSE